jgi:hypothetical protein
VLLIPPPEGVRVGVRGIKKQLSIPYPFILNKEKTQKIALFDSNK